MIPAIMSVIGGLTIPLFDVPLPPYTNALRFTAPIVGAWMVIGIVVFIWLRTSNRDALARMGDVFGGEGGEER